MRKPVLPYVRRSEKPRALARLPFAQRFSGRLALVALTVGLLSLTYAPIKQFYLAWVGLVPWLVLVGNARSKGAVFLWSWLTGYLFFAANMWWLGAITLPGLLALMLYMGIWFPLVGLTLWVAKILRADDSALAPAERSPPTLASPPSSLRLIGKLFLIPTLWVSAEWCWGNLMTGFPWLYIGHSQTPILGMCQIADVTGVYGVSFWIVLVNAWVALLILHRYDFRRLAVPGVAVALVLFAFLAYGLVRMNEVTQYPGPRVLVVQPNIPQDPNGLKGATYEEILSFHLTATSAALAKLTPDERPDLVVWSETMMPPINPEFRAALRADPKRQLEADFVEFFFKTLSQFAIDQRVTLAVGAGTRMPDDRERFNSVLVITPAGQMLPQRYDKIHLVPFGEFMPFRHSFPPLYRFFKSFDPNQTEYEATPGQNLTVFPMTDRAGSPWRFVTPICFEDVDSRLMSQMLKGENGGKRADFVINATNDGWFMTPQLQQHLQLATFRCIENRVPTARSVNTGISGFIDSSGRTHDLLPAHAEGTAIARVNLDRRVTFYTHWGDVFAGLCLTVSAAVLALALWNGMKNRKAGGR